MPNHVRTMIKFKNLKPDDIDNIIKLCTVPVTYDSSERKVGSPMDYPAIDFDKIIPEPRTIEDCDPRFVFSKEKIESGHTGVECTDDRIWFDWYNWRVEYWGTKWGAYDCDTKVGKSYIQFCFSTAWSLAYPIVQRLAVLGYDIEVKYADEDIGSNCGKLTYTREGGWTHWDESELKDPARFARNIWARY